MATSHDNKHGGTSVETGSQGRLDHSADSEIHDQYTSPELNPDQERMWREGKTPGIVRSQQISMGVSFTALFLALASSVMHFI